MAQRGSNPEARQRKVSVKHIGLVLDHLKVKPSTKLVAVILADHADSEGICFPSYRKIAERSGLDERSVRRHVKALIEMGVVSKLRTGTIKKSEGRTIRISNAYRIHASKLVGYRVLLSTSDLGIEDNVVHPDPDTGVQDRWVPLSTKPSMNRQVNRHSGGDVDNSKDREPKTLKAAIEQTMQEALHQLDGPDED
jgi:DNA-binding transcriptional ArsR family regulator